MCVCSCLCVFGFVFVLPLGLLWFGRGRSCFCRWFSFDFFIGWFMILHVFCWFFNDFRLVGHGFVYGFGLVVFVGVSMRLPCFDNSFCFIFFPFCSHASFIRVHEFHVCFMLGSCFFMCLFI